MFFQFFQNQNNVKQSQENPQIHRLEDKENKQNIKRGPFITKPKIVQIHPIFNQQLNVNNSNIRKNHTEREVFDIKQHFTNFNFKTEKKGEEFKKQTILKENSNLLEAYGSYHFQFSKFLAKEFSTKVNQNLLSKHLITPFMRMKMVDWMVEVLSVYECCPETFFLSVQIMDQFYEKTDEVLENERVHLLGMVSMFIAAKFQEINKIRMWELVQKIGQKEFKEEEYKNMERKILKTIGFENLIQSSTYEFLQTYFYDFVHNSNLTSQKEKQFFKLIKETSIFLSKVILHYEKFYKFDFCYKAIGCIIAAIMIVKEKKADLCSNEILSTLFNWIKFLDDKNGYIIDQHLIFAGEIINAFNGYFMSPGIAYNLKKFTPLSFLN